MNARKLLSFVLMFALIEPTFAQGFNEDLADKVDTSVGPWGGQALFGTGSGCSTKRSQSRLLDFFDNKTCQEAGSDILGEDITKPFCSKVYACTEKNETPIPGNEKSKLNFEFMNYIIRENIKGQLTKYLTPESNELRVLNAYVEKMPAKYKNKVRSCPAFKLSTTKCMNQERFDRLAKIAIKSYYVKTQETNVINNNIRRKRMASLIDSLQEPIPMGPSAPPAKADLSLKSLSKRDELVKLGISTTILGPAEDAEQTANVIEMVKDPNVPGKESTPEEIYTSLWKGEKEWAKQRKLEMNFDPGQDVVVNDIVKSVLLRGENLSPAEMKARIKQTIMKYATSKDDPYLSYDKNTLDLLDKEIDKLSISLKDLSDPSRSNLSESINDLRVKMVNDVFDRECQQRVVSVGQLCQAVSDNLKSAKVNGEVVNTDNLFEKMKESYNSLGIFSQEALMTQDFFDRLAKAKDQVYTRFIKVMFNLNSCREKFLLKDDVNPDDAKNFEELAKVEEKRASDSMNQSISNIAQVAKSDDVLRRELKSRGIDLESFKFDSKQATPVEYAINSSQNREGSKLNAVEKIDIDPRPFIAENSVQHSNQNMANQQIQNPNYNFVQPIPVVDNTPPAKDNQATDALEDKIKKLEKKESKLRKKIASSDADEESGSDESSELASLRKQIEDLKKEKDRVATGPVSAQETVDKQNVQTGRGPVSFESAGPIKVAGEKAAVESGSRNEEVTQARANAVSSNADYGAEAQSAIAAGGSRGPASTAANANAANKGAGEKGSNALVLSKSGEGVVESGAILDNPNEGDIASVMEKTKGEPFLIRENGELVKIAPILDSKGKPLLSSNGKMKFKKIKLTKAQQEIIAKETNVNKAAKEVGVEPTRLYKLKSLLKEVRRE